MHIFTLRTQREYLQWEGDMQILTLFIQREYVQRELSGSIPRRHSVDCSILESAQRHKHGYLTIF